MKRHCEIGICHRSFPAMVVFNDLCGAPPRLSGLRVQHLDG